MTGYGKRELAARAIVATGAARVCRHLPGSSGRLSILAYHRVYDMGDEEAFPFDPELVSATPADFRWQMEHVLRVGTPITFARLAQALDGGPPLPPRPIIVTFDDGHRDNFTHAFPVLRDLGIPATIFLSTGYVGRGGTFWFDRVVQLLHRAPEGPVLIPEMDFRTEVGTDVSGRRRAAWGLLERLKAVPNDVRLRAVTRLEECLSGPTPAEDEALSGAVSWQEVREMARAGIEFGSHTVSHPILTRLEDGPLEDELASSRRAIEENVGQPVTTIAYPVGGTEAFDPRVVAAVVRAGYRFGASYVSGDNAGAVDPYGLRRLHVERYTSRDFFQALLALPRLFA